MIEIKDLLSRFNNILASEGRKTDSIRMVISEVINVNIDPKDIQIRNNVIYLNIKPIYKNEVFLKQDQIFLRLKELFGEKTSQSIR